MSHLTHGIHHITAIATDPAQTVDFYTRILGLRLVKKSVNQDDVATYHLFFGDKTGEPGMDLTFFTFQPAVAGVRGSGQVTLISLAVADTELEFWQKRFQQENVQHEEMHQRFDRRRLIFFDADHQRLELVGVPEVELEAMTGKVWTTKEINKSRAIRCFYSARLSVISDLLVEPVLEQILGYRRLKTADNLHLYRLADHNRAALLEVEEAPALEPGLTAAGTVHHIAFAVKNETDQNKLRQMIIDLGLFPTEVINRYYFKSVYFRVPAGILFEIATQGPGFTADESEAELGKKLALPPFLEDRRAEIEANLPPIR